MNVVFFIDYYENLTNSSSKYYVKKYYKNSFAY